MAVSSDVYSCDDSETCTMSSSEETILLSLLPLFQKKLVVKQLQPFLKLFCSFTDDECDLVCGPNAALQKDSAALMLVEVLRRKSPQCCAQMLLTALQQSCTKSGRHIWGHNEVAGALQIKLASAGTPGGHSLQSKAWNVGEVDSMSASSTQENSSMNYFPSATLAQSSLYDSGTSGHALNGSAEHTHHFDEGAHFTNGVTEMVVSIGPSRDPGPTVEFKSPLSKKLPTEVAESLVIESKNIQSSFSDFVLEVCSLLQESSSVYIEKLQMWLSFQNCTGAVQSLKAFDSSSEVLRARSIPSLISSLKSYSSWYNYDLIGDIAKKFCGSKGVRAVEKYESVLHEYMQKVIVHCPPPSPELEDESKCSEVLRMELDLDFSATALKDLAIFKQTLCKVCDLDPRFLVLRRIDAVNYHLFWAVPKIAVSSAMRGLKSKWTSLEEKNVKAVSMSGQEVHVEVEVEQTSTKMKRSSSPSLSSIFDEIFSATTSCIKNDVAYLETLTNGNASSSAGGSITVSSADRQSTYSQVANVYSGEVPRLRKVKNKSKQVEKAQQLGASVQSEASTSSLLSEISESLNNPDLLSYPKDSAISVSPKVSSVRLGPSPVITRVQSMLVPSPQVVQTSERYSLNLTDHCILPPSPDFLMKKSVSFLWRVLGRASAECCANIHINAIYDVIKENEDDLCVRKGQLLKAMYRVGERIFVETLSMEHGFVPYSSCRIARKYYGAKSKVIQLSYLQLYLQSPDGLDLLPLEHVPSMLMVALSDHSSSSKEELWLKSGNILTCLYSDADVVYASCGGRSGIVPQASCELVKKLQPFFKSWQVSNQKFQSDFVIKLSEVRPAVLEEVPVTKTDVENRNCSSRVGKIFTVNQNFVPDSPNSSNFTIRKGLRVKVIDENQKHVCVSTKTGASFWIPFNYLRPARKNSDAEYNFQTPLS